MGMKLSAAILAGLPKVTEQSHQSYLDCDLQQTCTQAAAPCYCEACALGAALLGAGLDPQQVDSFEEAAELLKRLGVNGSRVIFDKGRLLADDVTAPIVKLGCSSYHNYHYKKPKTLNLFHVVDMLNYKLELSHEDIAAWLASKGW